MALHLENLDVYAHIMLYFVMSLAICAIGEGVLVVGMLGISRFNF